MSAKTHLHVVMIISNGTSKEFLEVKNSILQGIMISFKQTLSICGYTLLLVITTTLKSACFNKFWS